MPTYMHFNYVSNQVTPPINNNSSQIVNPTNSQVINSGNLFTQPNLQLSNIVKVDNTNTAAKTKK